MCGNPYCDDSGCQPSTQLSAPGLMMGSIGPSTFTLFWESSSGILQLRQPFESTLLAGILLSDRTLECTMHHNAQTRRRRRTKDSRSARQVGPKPSQPKDEYSTGTDNVTLTTQLPLLLAVQPSTCTWYF
eukprot:scpid37450/ scgid19551/ 